MLDHGEHFRQQLAHERCEGLTRDYRLAQVNEASVNPRARRVAWLPRLRQLSFRRRHTPAYPR